MNQSDNGQPGMDQLPYYQEYIEQILKPRVARVVEDVRANLTEQVWAELLARVAEDQKAGASADPKVVAKLRAMLEQTLKLTIQADLAAEFGGVAAPAPETANGHRPGGGGQPNDGREGVDVIDRNFPNNPLARAVGGMKRVGR